MKLWPCRPTTATHDIKLKGLKGPTFLITILRDPSDNTQEYLCVIHDNLHKASLPLSRWRTCEMEFSKYRVHLFDNDPDF